MSTPDPLAASLPEPRQIIGWNVYGSTAPGAKPFAFIPAEDAPGMTLDAEIALWLQDVGDE